MGNEKAHKFRINPQMEINIQDLILDFFCGGGGVSTGIEKELGRAVNHGVNHDQIALDLHKINHPLTKHWPESVWKVDIDKMVNGRNVALGWFSPDCTHFSKAKGGAPVKNEIRGLANFTLRVGQKTNMNLAIVENVPEFKGWGKVNKKGIPIKKHKGKMFKKFIKNLYKLGFTKIDHRVLNSADYGAPTARKRFFLVARRDELPVQWPEPTHFPRLSLKKPSYLPASTGIDFSIPCPSIFDRKKPLAENTCKRLAKGIYRYIIDCPDPFIVNNQPSFIFKYQKESPGTDCRDPLDTITSVNKHYLVTAFLAKHYTGATGSDLNDPIGTITTVDHHSLITATLISTDHTGSKSGGVQSIEDPLSTVTSKQRHGLIYAFLVKYYGNGDSIQSVEDPLHTITTKGRFALVTVKGVDYKIVDIGYRMLQPRELFTNQGFPEDFIIDGFDRYGKAFTKKKQTALCGNSVPPQMVEALIRANAPDNLYLREPKESA